MSHFEVKANSSLESYDGIGPPFNCVFKVRTEVTSELQEGAERRTPHPSWRASARITTEPQLCRQLAVQLIESYFSSLGFTLI